MRRRSGACHSMSSWPSNRNRWILRFLPGASIQGMCTAMAVGAADGLKSVERVHGRRDVCKSVNQAKTKSPVAADHHADPKGGRGLVRAPGKRASRGEPIAGCCAGSPDQRGAGPPHEEPVACPRSLTIVIRRLESF
jgi:hypothetical protein